MANAADCLILHVLPEDWIGGAELAARWGARETRGAIRTHFLASHPAFTDHDTSDWVSYGRRGSPMSFRATSEAVRLVRKIDPQVILFSLWRSVFAFLAVKLLFPAKKIAVLLHSSVDVHWADALATRLMIRLADEVWGDSEVTLGTRLGRYRGAKPIRTISFILKHPDPVTVPAAERPLTHFMSWSRLNAVKRLDLALQLIAELKKRGQRIRFTIIGPDSGVLQSLLELVKDLHLEDEVSFAGARDRGFIEHAARESTFYLQLSDYEGQSMAVVEAMQLGLVPVVTPAGAIAEYCRDGVNALLFKGVAQTADELEKLFDNPGAVARMASAARLQFASEPLYSDDMLDAASRLASAAK